MKTLINLRVLLFFLLTLLGLKASAQDVFDLKVDTIFQNEKLTHFLERIEKKEGIHFFYRPEWIDSLGASETMVNKKFGEILENLLRGTKLSHITMSASQVVFVKDYSQQLSRKKAIEIALRQQKKVKQYILGHQGKLNTTQRLKVRGKVVDMKTKEPLAHANIIVSDEKVPFATDETGKFELDLVPGSHVLNFSFVDHEDQIIDLLAYQDGEINLEMEEMPILLDEVVIQDRETRELTTSRIGQTQLGIKELKRAPAMLGEADLIKQVQTLPGVTTAGEAASGFNVRGGSVDQNLILYDGMPVFNSSHVFGFFSAFNPEGIREVSFYRGGIPAEYGGRASSVLDIRSKDGDYKKWNGNGGIGMLTSNFMINGPIQKDKTSISASVRSTYSNWLVHSIHTSYADLSNSSVFFYDGTLKLTHLFNDRTKLSFTGYSSKDAFRLIRDSTYQWSNLQGSMKLDHQFSSSFGSEFTFGVSKYGYKVLNSDYLTASILSYQITSTLLKAGFFYQEGNHKINFGWQLTHYQFEPGTLRPDSKGSNVKSLTLNNQYSIENAFYVADAWSVNEKVFVEAGLRTPLFAAFGPASVNVYKGTTRELSNLVDTLHFNTRQPIKSYFGFEPRLSFRLKVSPVSSIKFGYSRVYQFLHLVTNTTTVTPIDIWQPSGYYFKPQKADQFSLGYYKDIRSKKYGASIETFYKTVNNIIDFKDGAQLILNNHLETDLLQGKGWSYGIESSITKNTGRITGTLNYTFSRSFRQIAGPTAAESINLGKAYPSNFDQPHIVNLSWKYNLSRRYFFTGNFTYHTGRPVTIPLSAFHLENMTVAYFSERNQYRIPDYHRLDLALVFEGNHRRKKWGEGTWVISIYNVYGRKNAYSVFFKSSGAGIPQPYQLSILGSALPSISYNFKF
jgi:hypothetical protein